MAIVPLVKVTLYGPAAEKDAVLDGLQRLGCVHLVDLRGTAGDVPSPPHTAVDARTAWQYLRDSPVRRPPLRRAPDVDLAGVVKEALDIRERARALVEERAQVAKAIVDLAPWGDFELPEWTGAGPCRFWFYAVPLHQVPRLETLPVAWRVVTQNHRFAYVIVVAADEPAGVPGTRATLDARSLSTLRARREQIERELEELDYRRIGLTLYRDLLGEALDEADDQAARERAGLMALERDQLFAVQGWAPAARAADLQRFAGEHTLALTIAAPGPGDAPPTLLHNTPALRGGESMVTFYKTPAYSAWDPSQAVFVAFAIFFGMIVSDGGYGLVWCLLLLVWWKRLGQTADGRTMRSVLATLGICSVVYGALVGSYFALTPPRDSWLGRFHILDADDQSFMMWLSVVVGATHLGLANLVTAWRRRKSPTALRAVGWAGIILGGCGMALGHTHPPLARLWPVGVGSVGVGAVLVLLFSSERPFGLAPKLVLGRFVDGLLGLTEFSKAFGDVLSYLRLFALGLAAIKLGQAFNGLAGDAFAVKGIGVVFALFILAIGHSINFAMGIMGGVVHGLRLNVVEFFNWSLQEEGEEFRVFAKKVEG